MSVRGFYPDFLLQKTAPALLEFCSVALGTSLYLSGGPNDGRCEMGDSPIPLPAGSFPERFRCGRDDAQELGPGPVREREGETSKGRPERWEGSWASASP